MWAKKGRILCFHGLFFTAWEGQWEPCRISMRVWHRIEYILAYSVWTLQILEKRRVWENGNIYIYIYTHTEDDEWWSRKAVERSVWNRKAAFMCGSQTISKNKQHVIYWILHPYGKLLIRGPLELWFC